MQRTGGRSGAAPRRRGGMRAVPSPALSPAPSAAPASPQDLSPAAARLSRVTPRRDEEAASPPELDSIARTVARLCGPRRWFGGPAIDPVAALRGAPETPIAKA